MSSPRYMAVSNPLIIYSALDCTYLLNLTLEIISLSCKVSNVLFQLFPLGLSTVFPLHLTMLLLQSEVGERRLG